MRKGFSLIELLIVAAIAASLAVVLIPVFATAQSETGAQKCQVHGMKLGAAMLAYMSDHDGRFPGAATQEMLAKFASITWRYRWPGDPRPGRDVWGVSGISQFAYIQLAKYVKNKDTWICPAAPNLNIYGLKYAYGYRCSWTFLSREFLYDSRYPDTPFQTSTGIGRTLTEVQASDASAWRRYLTPGRKILGFCWALGPDVPVETYVGGPIEPPLYPHNEGSIYLYADGHACWRETGCAWAPVGYTNSHVDRAHPRT